MYRASARNLVNTVPIWAKQRPCSEQRVDEIVKDESPFEEVFDPTHPDADERGVVLYPNVNTMKEMADLVTAVRSYEANISVQENFERMADRVAAMYAGRIVEFRVMLRPLQAVNLMHQKMATMLEQLRGS